MVWPKRTSQATRRFALRMLFTTAFSVSVISLLSWLLDEMDPLPFGERVLLSFIAAMIAEALMATWLLLKNDSGPRGSHHNQP